MDRFDFDFIMYIIRYIGTPILLLSSVISALLGEIFLPIMFALWALILKPERR